MSWVGAPMKAGSKARTKATAGTPIRVLLANLPEVTRKTAIEAATEVAGKVLMEIVTKVATKAAMDVLAEVAVGAARKISMEALP